MAAIFKPASILIKDKLCSFSFTHLKTKKCFFLFKCKDAVTHITAHYLDAAQQNLVSCYKQTLKSLSLLSLARKRVQRLRIFLPLASCNPRDSLTRLGRLQLGSAHARKQGRRIAWPSISFSGQTDHFYKGKLPASGFISLMSLS